MLNYVIIKLYLSDFLKVNSLTEKCEQKHVLKIKKKIVKLEKLCQIVTDKSSECQFFLFCVHKSKNFAGFQLFCAIV